MKFTASATAQGYAFTENKTLVTSSASANGISEISYEDALIQASELAQDDANLTAIYDANLINQSVTEANAVAKERMMYNKMQINSSPDLTFYFNLEKKYYDNSIKLENTGIIATVYEPLFSDILLTQNIGKTGAQIIIFDIENINGNYTSVTTRYFFLQNGSITITTTDYNTSLNNTGYIHSEGEYLYQIVSGSGLYLNKTGIVSVNFDNVTFQRKVNVYFNNY